MSSPEGLGGLSGKEAFCMSNPLQPECCPDSIPPQRLSAHRTQSLEEHPLRTRSLDQQAFRTQSLGEQSLLTCCVLEQTPQSQTLHEHVLRTQSFNEPDLPTRVLHENALRTHSCDERTLRSQSLDKHTLRSQSLDKRILGRETLRDHTLGGATGTSVSMQHDGCCNRATSCRTISGNLALDPMITCKLCLCECKLHDMHQMHRCACVYCKKCLQQYVIVLTEEGAVTTVTCPDAACKDGGKMEEQEVQQLVDENVFRKYQKVKFMKEIELDPTRAWCPRVGCDTVCRLPDPDNHGSKTDQPHLQDTHHQSRDSNTDQTHLQPKGSKPEDPHPQGKEKKGKKQSTFKIPKGQRFVCSKCGLKFCSICKSSWHGHKSCSKFSRGATASSGRSKGTSTLLDMLGIQKEDSDEARIKRCPFCHIPIERDAGCAQMMCKNCQHVFCWYCLANLDNDFLLRHYDKGPCKNKLGHSRATVIFHRAQIVCVFAGFGFLLLLASPFLLVVAPCIICCKSKWGCMWDDFDDIPDS